MSSRPTTVLLAGLFSVVFAGTGFAAEVECGSFSLKGGEKVIQVVDNPPQGASPGDVRAGNRQLLDKRDEPVAVVHFSATLTALPSATSGSTFASQYFLKFSNGWIATASVYELADAEDTSQRAGNAVLLVTGGTDAFENVAGTVEIEAGDPPTYVFDLVCG